MKPLAILAGAGPGDIGLVTLATSKWLTVADVVIYDRLANPRLLDLCRDDAEKIYVGKGPSEHSMTQEQINALLVEKCRAGKLVVRLKGGDPFIFGRGGEEADALVAAGFPFRVVPGVTAGIAAGAYAGIPLTDRRLASTLAFVTGHEDPAKDDSTIAWGALAKIDTVVLYMGVSRLADIARRLMAAGRAGETPAAIIERATTPRQRTVVATLATLEQAARDADIRPPSIIVIGEVAALRQRLAWRERLPLFGRTVLVTRTRRQASQLSARLEELGAAVIEAPTLEILPPPSWDAVDSALRRLRDFDWLVLTSPNGAEMLFSRMQALGLDARALAGVRVAAVGEGTAAALRQRSILPDLVPETFTTEALGKALGSVIGHSSLNVAANTAVTAPRPEERAPATAPRILLARADIATPGLAEALHAAGARTEELLLYRSVRPAALSEEAATALREGIVDWITFTSSSTVENFLAMVGESAPGDAPAVDLSRVKLAAIGPVTAGTLKARGLAPTVIASPHTVGALVEAILQLSGADGAAARE